MDDLVCYCFYMTRDELVRLIKDEQLTSVEDVSRSCRAGTGCGCCRDDIAALVEARERTQE